MGIKHLNWGYVPTLALGHSEAAGRVAVWPTPVHADRCFAEAGCTDFDDDYSDEELDAKDAEWKDVIAAAIRQLTDWGAVETVQAVDAGEVLDDRSLSARLWRVLTGAPPPVHPLNLTLEEQLFAVTFDDQFGPVVVRFGDPPRAWLSAGEGHKVLWIAIDDPEIDPQRLVEQIAAGRPVARVDLKWSALLPDRLELKSGA